MNPREVTAIDRAVGRRIREARTRAKLTQADLAGMVGISRTQLCKIEDGLNRVSAGRLVAIARRLNTSACSLLSGTDGFDALIAVMGDVEAIRRATLSAERRAGVEDALDAIRRRIVALNAAD